MKLTAAIRAITAATERLGISLAAKTSGRIALLAEIGDFYERLYPADGVHVSDRSTATEEIIVAFFTTKTDNVTLAESVGRDFYKTLVDDARFSEEQFRAFFKRLSDAARIAEQHQLATAKSLRDGVRVAEDQAVLRPNKLVSDQAVLSDNATFDFGQYLSNAAQFTERLALDTFRGLSHPATVSERLQQSVQKLIADDVFFTDDIDGNASILDDQEMEFFKLTTDSPRVTDSLFISVEFVRRFEHVTNIAEVIARATEKSTSDSTFASEFSVRHLYKVSADSAVLSEQLKSDFFRSVTGDAASLTDRSVLNSGLVKTESTLLSDAGSLRSQGYCDFTYFAEDFVGASRTF